MSEAHRRATRLWPTVGRAAHERHKVATSGAIVPSYSPSPFWFEDLFDVAIAV
jgi:hypothetical protein